MDEHYHTTQSPAEGEYKEKGSRFLAYAYPVDGKEDIKERVAALKKRYHDARHHCYAYILGASAEEFRANDDGEPNHSAGDPILGQIRAFGLTNVLVVVVRYFGGTKLGVGGLIHAYKTAAGEALGNSVVIKVELKECINLRFDYGATSEVMRCVRNFGLEIKGQEYREDCYLSLAVKIRDVPKVRSAIQLLVDTGHPVEVV